MGGGSICCKYFKRKADLSIDPLCNGGDTQSSDPAVCCLHDNYQPCSNTVMGCRDHPWGRRKRLKWKTFCRTFTHFFFGRLLLPGFSFCKEDWRLVLQKTHFFFLESVGARREMFLARQGTIARLQDYGGAEIRQASQ
jgi:hypothetical protein